MACEMTTGNPKAGTCLLCGTGLSGRQRKWCSTDCSDSYWKNHSWDVARPAALKRDGYRCVRCGHVGWSDVPSSILFVAWGDPEVVPYTTRPEHWAVALGLLNPQDLEPLHGDWFAENRRWDRIRTITDQLPASIHTLTQSELRRPPYHRRHRTTHELEVNHIVPREGRGYTKGCHHHQDNLETLCRPCHVDETRRQRLGLPSWRLDDRPVEVLLGRGVQEVLV